MEEKIFEATGIHVKKCDCGCDNLNTYLLDETGLARAIFQLSPDEAVSYANALIKAALLAKQKVN